MAKKKCSKKCNKPNCPNKDNVIDNIVPVPDKDSSPTNPPSKTDYFLGVIKKMFGKG